jgi:hypothetical protein
MLTPDNTGLVFAVGDEVISSCLMFGICGGDGWQETEDHVDET